MESPLESPGIPPPAGGLPKPLGLERELVLVAEDDLANRALLARLLERAGYRSLTVALILLDFTLPDVDGFELAARLRHDPGTSTIPIWLTAPAGLPPEAKARLNGNVLGVLEHGEDALVAMHGWLETGRRPAPAMPADGAATTPASPATSPGPATRQARPATSEAPA